MAFPNVVLLLFDCLSSRDCDLYTDQNITPNIAGILGKSTVFENAYAPSPESSPARASFFTGLDPAVHGLWTNGVMLPEKERTFPEALAQIGYKNWLAGRRQLAGVSNWTTEVARPNEYAHFDWAHGPLHRSRQNAYLAWLQHTHPETYFDIFPSQPDPDLTEIDKFQFEKMAHIADELSFNHWVGDQISKRIKKHKDGQPFFACAGFCVGNKLGSHTQEEGDFEQLNQRALEQSDQAIGEILQAIRAKGAYEDTIIILTSGRGNIRSHGQHSYMSEQLIKVPLALSGPDICQKKVKDIVSTIDIAPTIYDLIGMPIPTRMQGSSIVAGDHRGWNLSRLRHGADADKGSWLTAFNSTNYKLIVSHLDSNSGALPTYSLFDLANDPNEQNDLASNLENADLLEDMIDQMIDARCAMEDRTEPRIASF